MDCSSTVDINKNVEINIPWIYFFCFISRNVCNPTISVNLIRFLNQNILRSQVLYFYSCKTTIWGFKKDIFFKNNFFLKIS